MNEEKSSLHVGVFEADILFNSLYKNPDPANLMNDILAIQLPNGYYIDVGWYPQFDPSGQYKVSILDQEGSIIALIISTQNVREVIEAIREYKRIEKWVDGGV